MRLTKDNLYNYSKIYLDDGKQGEVVNFEK